MNVQFASIRCQQISCGAIYLREVGGILRAAGTKFAKDAMAKCESITGTKQLEGWASKE